MLIKKMVLTREDIVNQAFGREVKFPSFEWREIKDEPFISIKFLKEIVPQMFKTGVDYNNEEIEELLLNLLDQLNEPNMGGMNE